MPDGYSAVSIFAGGTKIYKDIFNSRLKYLSSGNKRNVQMCIERKRTLIPSKKGSLHGGYPKRIPFFYIMMNKYPFFKNISPISSGQINGLH
jgi:hypothetical protein